METTKSYGLGVEERVVEYPWLFSRLNLEGSHDTASAEDLAAAAQTVVCLEFVKNA